MNKLLQLDTKKIKKIFYGKSVQIAEKMQTLTSHNYYCIVVLFRLSTLIKIFCMKLYN